MSSTSFGSDNRGVQLTTNHGIINISPDRPETPAQKTDNELLRSLAFPQMLDRRDNIEACHTNTCEWILELDEYQSWRNQPCGLLWIKGKPGAGKSTLMLFLHDRLKELQDGSQGVIRLDFFFTARGVEMQRTPLGMFRSLLNQIFVRDATIRPLVREVYEQRCRQFGFGERKWEWPQTVLEELLASAILASAMKQHLIIFVDALDEAGAESAQKIAAYFHRLVGRADKKKLTLQVCISCRHYPILESARARAIHVEDYNQDDIATYIKDMLLETEFRDIPSQEKRELLVEELAQHAKGVFQWVHLIIPLVKRRFSEGESISDIRDWLGDVPADLENVYVYILSNVITARNRVQSFLFFQWVCLAERPLTLVEMRYALAAMNAQITSSRIEWEKLHGFVESDERMKLRVKVLAGGLAEVVSSEKNEATVQVVHQSVNDFLRDKGLALLYPGIGASLGSLDMDNILFLSQATLYRSCLVYLTTISSNKQMSIFQDSKEKLVCDHPFLNYATINLFIHAKKAADFRGASMPNEIENLQRIIRYWVEIYQRLDTYHTACPATGTTILHMAAAANLVDVITSALSGDEDIERKNEVGNTALHFAARGGHTIAGKILQARGANRDAQNINGASPLIEAARCGHLGFVSWLLGEGVNIETGGGAALQKAALEGHSAIVVILLGAGANVNAQGGEYGNALQAAAYDGSAETVKILLDAGADVNAQGGQYGNALQAAAYDGSAETVKILLDAGADVNAQGGQYGNALQAAGYDGSAETVKILLDAGADVNAQGGEYGNALQAAAWRGSAETVKIILDAGADVNAQGGYFGNALQAAGAAYDGSAERVKILLDAGADVNAQGGQYGNALQAAASDGSAERVKILLDAGADVNAQGGQYGNALQAAGYDGSAETVKILLDAGADVNAQGGYFGNALQAAAYDGSAETVKILLDAGADVNAQGGPYGNALQAAGYDGSAETVKILLDAGADVNAQGGEYGNALQAAGAAYDGSAERVKILLDAGADVNAQCGYFGNALQAAAWRGSAERVKILLDAGADVNAQGGYFGNALQAAASDGSAERVKILLDAGADVNAQGGYFGNALQAAAWRGSAETVKIILDAGADVNAQGGYFGNALQAAASDGSAETVKILLDAGADVNAQGGEYGNALQAAAWRGSAETVKILLDAGADVNAQGGPYGNALQAAAWRGSAETVKILLDAGADVNAQGGQYGNALQAAAWRGSAETVKIILDAGADVNAQGGPYGNALQAAAWRGSAETVKILLDAGADVNAQGGQYGNALQAAAWRGSAETVKILLNAGADVNVRGGQHGSPLLAAIYSGHANVTDILFHAGADFGLADALDQTPLHIAASRNMAHLLLQFPQLASAINKRNKFLQTPLLLAIYSGHIHFSMKLLHLGADPSLRDGYGKHAMDWALGQETLMREIRERCPQLSLTPHENQESIVQQSLFHLTDGLPDLSPNDTWLILQQLARYFLFLNETNNARYLFRIDLSHNSSFTAHMSHRTGITAIDSLP
ncbi:hypothetical protein N7456_007049 [Penicillium angulare]|uniref:Nephrocystin 3-like N-terminal domain-containing protein n=1 Tax=Penicillium angulare TaxID=116970 RepID=A0A9W9KDH3_9EURO|nr:hypothetical protein N7456_007049 [Penicillium angulare]